MSEQISNSTEQGKQYRNNFNGTITLIAEKPELTDRYKNNGHEYLNDLAEWKASQIPIPLTFKTDKEVLELDKDFKLEKVWLYKNHPEHKDTFKIVAVPIQNKTNDMYTQNLMRFDENGTPTHDTHGKAFSDYPTVDVSDIVEVTPQLTMKAFRLKFMFRLLALIDVLFAERFELTTYKNGKVRATTRFDKKEIENAKL